MQRERGTPAPNAADIEISNFTGMKDKVIVHGLATGDIVKVYASEKGAAILGTVVSTGKEETVVSIAQLGTDAGSAYISVTEKGKLENSKILVINNPGTDVVIVYGLSAGETVKLYSASTGGIAITKATVAAGQTQAILTVKQLGADGGLIKRSIWRAKCTFLLPVLNRFFVRVCLKSLIGLLRIN